MKIFKPAKWHNIAYATMDDGRSFSIDQFYIIRKNGDHIKFRWFSGDAGTNNGYESIDLPVDGTTLKRNVDLTKVPFITSKCLNPVFGSSHKTLGSKCDIYMPEEWFDISEFTDYVTEKGEASIKYKIVYKNDPSIFTIDHARFEQGWL